MDTLHRLAQIFFAMTIESLDAHLRDEREDGLSDVFLSYCMEVSKSNPISPNCFEMAMTFVPFLDKVLSIFIDDEPKTRNMKERVSDPGFVPGISNLSDAAEFVVNKSKELISGEGQGRDNTVETALAIGLSCYGVMLAKDEIDYTYRQLFVLSWFRLYSE